MAGEKRVGENFLDHLSGKPGEAPACRAHRHLVETCPECRQFWEQIGPTLQDAHRERLAKVVLSSEPPRLSRRNLSTAPATFDAIYGQTRQVRYLRRRARKQLSELRQTPRERRLDKVRSADCRFRSRMLAELLIDEARSLVRNDPVEAESFASLVPHVLHWTRGADGPAWGHTLIIRAEAHRANALRVAGGLPAADRAFEILRQSLMFQSSADADSLGEVASLMASLRIDQRRLTEGEEFLDRAVVAFTVSGNGDGLARAKIQLANLKRVTGNAETVLELLDAAATALGPGANPRLVVGTVTGRVNALCDLDRAAEARELLSQHLDPYEQDDSPYTAALLRCIEGRISLGLEEYAEAEEYFAACAEVMSSLGRSYDAAVAGLFLAETYLRSGQVTALRRLARDLVGEFRDRGVAREAREALELFAKAVATQEVTVRLLQAARAQVLRAAQGLPPATF